MKTYAQIQNKVGRSRIIENGSLQKKKQTSLLQYNEGGISSSVNRKGVIQGAFKVKESKILADILDKDLCSRVFTGTTKDWIAKNIMEKPENQNEKYIKDNRKDIKFEKLSPNYTVSDSSKLLEWLNKEPSMEHIYLYKNSTIHGGISGFDNKSNKNPHPTILGGDEEVDFAGIMYEQKSELGDKTNTVVLNNDSGHYPVDYEESCGGAKATLKRIAQHHHITSQKAR